MDAFAYETNVSDLHTTHVRFGGDVFLKPGTQRPAEQISKDSECQSEGHEQESPTGGTRSLKWCPGKSPREKRSGRHIGSTALMDSESAFACFESPQRFRGGSRYIFKLKIAEQKKAGRVGMSRHGAFVRTREDVKCGMFKRMVSSCFKDEWEIE